MTRFRPAAPLAAVALAYLATLALLPPGGLWIVDNGAKRIQVESLLASGLRDFSLDWPGRRVDPDLEYNPLPYAFSVVKEGRLYSVFSPVFPALSLLPFRWLGEAGLCLLPLLASLALLHWVGRIAALAGLSSPGLAILVAGLATPLWFYAVVFWEHALAAAFATGAVAWALACLRDGRRRQAFVSGLLIALGAGLRDPLLLFAAVLGILVCVEAPRERLRVAAAFGLGLAAGLLPLVGFQWLALGDPLGFHLTHGFAARAGETAGLLAHLRARGQAFANLLLAAQDGPALSALAAGPFVLLLIVRPRLPERAFRAAVLATAAWALVGALAFAAGFAAAESPVRWLYRTNGFFAAAPLLAVGLVRRRENGPESASGRALRCLLALVLAYTVLYVALTPLRNTTGIHWGNRYLLELYPLLAVPCAAALLALRERPRARLGMALLALLAAASVALQLLSLDLLRRKLVFGEKLEHAVRAYPGLPIVTDVWWVPQTLAREFHRRPLYFVSAADDLRSLLERLARHGETGFLFVTTDVARAPDAGARSIDDEGLGFFSLRLSPHPLVGRTRQRVSFEPGRPSQRGVDAR